MISVVLLWTMMLPIAASAQEAPDDEPTSSSSSPEPVPPVPSTEPGLTSFAITGIVDFDEFPIGTTITNQYEDQGIVFRQSQPVFITSDTAQPGSPVLTGTPRFEGPIEARIVDPVTGADSVTDGISIDVGFIDSVNSVRVTARDSAGAIIATERTDQIGINQIQINQPGIAEVSVRTVGDEPSGFSIDNVILGEITDGEVLYVALGDSFASGEGAGNYSASSGDCHRSDNAYAVELADANDWNLSFRACSGAVIGQVDGTAGGTETNQIASLTEFTDLVTVSIGGNDAGFVAEIRDCFLFGCADAEPVRETIHDVREDLVDILGLIKFRAPNATVLLIGYPKLFAPQGNCQSFGVPDIAQINMWTEFYNHAAAAAASEVGVHYIDMVDAFDGRHRCDANSAVNQTNVGNFTSPERMHPNRAGHNLMRREIDRYLTSIGGVGAPNPVPGILTCGGRQPTLLATAARDDLRGHDGIDVIIGGSRVDRIDGHGGVDFACGRGGADAITAGEGSLFAWGGGADDRIIGSDERDTLRGGAGADEIFGRGGADTVLGGSGDDELYGSDAADRLFGDSGDDLLDGGRGADSLDGGADDDECIGGPGADVHLGGCEDLDL